MFFLFKIKKNMYRKNYNMAFDIFFSFPAGTAIPSPRCPPRKAFPVQQGVHQRMGVVQQGRVRGEAIDGLRTFKRLSYNPDRIHGAAIYGNMDPIHIPQMLTVSIYTSTMDPMGNDWKYHGLNVSSTLSRVFFEI
jgi:hypothetical protein